MRVVSEILPEWLVGACSPPRPPCPCSATLQLARSCLMAGCPYACLPAHLLPCLPVAIACLPSSQLLGPVSTWCSQGKNKGPCQPLSTRSLNMSLADMGLVVRGLSAHVGKRHVNAENKLLVNLLSTCTPLVALPSSVPHLHSILGAGKLKTLGQGEGGADAPQPRPPTQMQRRQCTLGKGICEGGKGRAESVCWWCAQRGRQLGWWGVAARGSAPPPPPRETAV